MDAKKGTIDANFVRPGTLGSIVTTILDFAVSRGITVEEIAQVMDLSAVDYARLDTRISNDEVGRLMSLMINRWPNTAISMEIARSAPFRIIRLFPFSRWCILSNPMQWWRWWLFILMRIRIRGCCLKQLRV